VCCVSPLSSYTPSFICTVQSFHWLNVLFGVHNNRTDSDTSCEHHFIIHIHRHRCYFIKQRHEGDAEFLSKAMIFIVAVFLLIYYCWPLLTFDDWRVDSLFVASVYLCVCLYICVSVCLCVCQRCHAWWVPSMTPAYTCVQTVLNRWNSAFSCGTLPSRY